MQCVQAKCVAKLKNVRTRCAVCRICYKYRGLSRTLYFLDERVFLKGDDTDVTLIWHFCFVCDVTSDI